MLFIFSFQVRVEVETCEELRPMNPSDRGKSGKAAHSSGQYGFADKVVDGVTVTVNSVMLTLHSKVFTASFQVNHLVKVTIQHFNHLFNIKFFIQKRRNINHTFQTRMGLKLNSCN